MRLLLVRRWRAFFVSTDYSLFFCALLAFICVFPLVRSLIDSLPFPWYGNPDQDLVFLRDGLRLWNFRQPLYGDHPGLIQMLTVWVSLFYLKVAAVFGFVAEIDSYALSDSDWQRLFVAAKIVNALAMSMLLYMSSLMLVRWLGCGWTALWALCCATSMALVSEVYQLRNEFYSVFIALISILVSINGFFLFRSRSRRLIGSPSLSIGFVSAAALICLGLGFLALMAKVQVLPLMLFFSGVVVFLAYFLSEFRFLTVYLSCLLWIGSCVLIAGIFLPDFFRLSLAQAAVVALAIAGPPALLMSSLASLSIRGHGLTNVWLVINSVAFVSLSAFFLFVAVSFDWFVLLLNPLVARVHAVAYGACAAGDLLCVGRQGMRGFYYLFERSIDSYALAPFVGFAVLLLALLPISRALHVSFVSSRHDLIRLRLVPVLCGCFCLLFAMAMAFIAGQRWSVDHYLSYQQPFLFAGLFLMARSSLSFAWFWRSVSVVVLFSLLLVYMRYPVNSRSTYVKESLLVDPVLGRGDGSLCARQHSGSEWRYSSLWDLCDGFSID
jgi:hypothetical protein